MRHGATFLKSGALASAACEIRVYQNGAATPSDTIPLTGSIPASGVYVLAHPDAAFGGDQTSELRFNGGDAVALVCGGSLVDVIGQIGCDPGSEWGTGNTSTANNTLRRKTSICTGDANGADAFDPAVEWDGFAQDDFSGLGAHSAGCGPDTTPPTIVSVTLFALGPTAATQVSFKVIFSEAISDFDDPTDVAVNASGAAYMGLLDVLLAWHAEDLVDAKERERNEVVFLFQGNRNPFVDYPERVDCLWLGVCALPEELFADSFASGGADACRRREAGLRDD